MDLGLFLGNIPVLFFFLGALAVFLGSDLELPAPLPKLFTLYLLLAIGLRGGAELSRAPLGAEVAWTLVAGVLAAAAIPCYVYFIMRRFLGAPDAAGVAATYGSVSAVTFITASGFLDAIGQTHGGHLVAVTALVETPSVLVAVTLARLRGRRASTQPSLFSWKEFLRDTFFNGSILLLVGALLIGLLAGSFNPKGIDDLVPFTRGWLFNGVLCLFLLDLGLTAARRVGDLRGKGPLLIVAALLIPLLNAALGIGIGRLVGMSAANAFLFTVILASGSYIVVPAALRYALPEANPGLFLPMALAVTFPFNILFGLPLYWSVIQTLWRLS
jgi:hypothetical protein